MVDNRTHVDTEFSAQNVSHNNIQKFGTSFVEHHA
jgi:hypothetical protein